MYLLIGLGLSFDVFVDNQAAIHIGMNDTSSKRSKHINLRFNNVREKVVSGLIKLRYIPTKDQLADILTKCLATPDFIRLRDQIMGKW